MAAHRPDTAGIHPGMVVRCPGRDHHLATEAHPGIVARRPDRVHAQAMGGRPDMVVRRLVEVVLPGRMAAHLQTLLEDPAGACDAKQKRSLPFLRIPLFNAGLDSLRSPAHLSE